MAGNNPVVGSGNYSPTTKPTVVPTATLKPTIPGLFDKINSKLADKTGITIDPAETQTVGFVDSLSNSQLELIGKVLKTKGYTIKASAAYIKRLFSTEFELQSIASSAGTDYNKLISSLAEDILPGLAKGTSGTAENLPSRNVYKYSDADLDTIVSDVYARTAMREPTAQELEAARTKIRPKLEQGTVSTTKKVKNPKTGKLEVVTTQEAGPTKEAVAMSLEEELKKLNPDEYDRTKRIEFSSWLSKNVEGA